MSKSVLIIEDSPELRILASILLSSSGWQVHEASDGQQALAHLAESLPDIVLLDSQLPDLQGFEILEQLRADPHTRHLCVVLFSASTAVDERYRQLGLAGRIDKPFDPDLLADALEAFLGPG